MDSKPLTMFIGYARVSTQDQSPDLQKDALEKIGCSEIYTDKVTGTAAQKGTVHIDSEIYAKGVSKRYWTVKRRFLFRDRF